MKRVQTHRMFHLGRVFVKKRVWTQVKLRTHSNAFLKKSRLNASFVSLGTRSDAFTRSVSHANETRFRRVSRQKIFTWEERERKTSTTGREKDGNNQRKREITDTRIRVRLYSVTQCDVVLIVSSLLYKVILFFSRRLVPLPTFLFFLSFVRIYMYDESWSFTVSLLHQK
jgi:hypothetical protein